jgi:hypothetical protein
MARVKQRKSKVRTMTMRAQLARRRGGSRQYCTISYLKLESVNLIGPEPSRERPISINLANSVNEVVIILDLGPMDVRCSFCRTIPVVRVQSCNDVMEFEKFISGKFKTSTLPYNTGVQSVFTT